MEFEQYNIPSINHDIPHDKALWSVCAVVVLNIADVTVIYLLQRVLEELSVTSLLHRSSFSNHH